MNRKLKRYNIRLKSSFLFRLLDMSMICQHVHRLELRKFVLFFVAHLPVKRKIRTIFNLIRNTGIIDKRGCRYTKVLRCHSNPFGCFLTSLCRFKSSKIHVQIKRFKYTRTFFYGSTVRDKSDPQQEHEKHYFANIKKRYPGL